MLKIEADDFFIQILEFGLESYKFLLHVFCSCAGDNHNQDFFFFGMGRKAKTKTLLVRENLDLGKTLMGNWGLTWFWTLSKG